MRQLKNFAAATLVMLLCAVAFGFFLTSCENGVDGTPEFTASVKTIKIEVPIHVTDTVWNTVYDTTTVVIRDTVNNTIIVRDTTIVIKHDTTNIYVEVVKKEGLEKNGEPGLEKIDDKSYLTWYPLLEDGKEIEPATELNVRAEMQDCDHDIIVVSSPIIGAPMFYAEKSTRSYQDGDFTKLEFKATWIYNFGSFTEKVNTVHEAAWYKGWQMLSSYWTGGLKAVEYGEGQPYTYEGIEGMLYENTLTWEFTYNENDVRTFTKTHKFFVPAEGEEPVPTPDKELVSVVEKDFDGEDTYIITRFYDDGTYSDTVVVNNYGYNAGITMPTLDRLYRDNTNFGKPTISENGSAVKTGNSYQHGGLIFQKMSQNMTASYNGHAHDITLQYTELTYTEGGKSCELTVPMWVLEHSKTSLGNVREEKENNHNYEVTPVSFIYNAAFGKNAASAHNTDTEVWNDKGEEAHQDGTIGKEFGFDYVNPTTSYTYATFYAIMSDGTEKELGTDGVQIFNSIEAPASQNIDTDNFNVVDANPVEGSKQLVSSREVTGKYGKFIVRKYKTNYTTKTNKTSVVFVAYHEEAEFVPTIGDSFAMLSKTYELSDNGSSELVDLGRKDGKTGKMYKSEISGTFNGHTEKAAAEVNLWVAEANVYGIASGSQSHTWDYNNGHHIATIFVYNIYDEAGNVVDGGLKGFIDGKEVIKKSWDEVNAPSGIPSLAQTAGGTWVFCRAYESGDAYIWRSIEKSNNNSAITSVEINQIRVANHGEPSISIVSSSKENADGSVTVSSSFGSATAAAW